MFITIKPRVGGQYTVDGLKRYSNIKYVWDKTHNKYYAISFNGNLDGMSLIVETTEKVNFGKYQDIMYAQRTGQLKKTDRTPILFEVLDEERALNHRFTLADVF